MLAILAMLGFRPAHWPSIEVPERVAKVILDRY
jgi:hypothetical protein